MKKENIIYNEYSDGAVWHRFGLSYAAYAVLPRVALCSMPAEWQEKFVALINEAVETLPQGTFDGEYMVRKKENGKFVCDPFSNYRHHPPLKRKP